MTENYIDQLLELAAGIVTLADAESTLDKREWKAAKEQHDSLEAKFKEVRNIYVDFLLGTPEGHDQAYALGRVPARRMAALVLSFGLSGPRRVHRMDGQPALARLCWPACSSPASI